MRYGYIHKSISTTNGGNCNMTNEMQQQSSRDLESHFWIRKILLTNRFQEDTSAVPSECNHGYSLGVALTTNGG
jgi:hypothetical protein